MSFDLTNNDLRPDEKKPYPSSRFYLRNNRFLEEIWHLGEKRLHFDLKNKDIHHIDLVDAFNDIKKVEHRRRSGDHEDFKATLIMFYRLPKTSDRDKKKAQFSISYWKTRA